MIVSIHQPHYLPWLGYLDKVDCADVFVLLDCVQFEKNGWQNRNRIKTADGWMWLTVPVKHSMSQSIAETMIDNTTRWQSKHIQALITNYSKTSFFKKYMEYFQEVYSRTWESLSELNGEMLRFFISTTGITTRIINSSSLGELSVDPNERLVQIVKKVGGDIYLAGSGCKDYYIEALFKEAGISVVFQDYKPEAYTQLYGEFLTGLSVVDALFNLGDGTMEIIHKGRRTVL